MDCEWVNTGRVGESAAMVVAGALAIGKCSCSCTLDTMAKLEGKAEEELRGTILEQPSVVVEDGKGEGESSEDAPALGETIDVVDPMAIGTK